MENDTSKYTSKYFKNTKRLLYHDVSVETFFNDDINNINVNKLIKICYIYIICVKLKNLLLQEEMEWSGKK